MALRKNGRGGDDGGGNVVELKLISKAPAFNSYVECIKFLHIILFPPFCKPPPTMVSDAR